MSPLSPRLTRTESNGTRWLDREMVAEYISVRVDHLPRLQKAGKLPAPSYHLGPRSPRWDRAALDALFTGGVASGDPVAIAQRAVQRMRNAKPARRLSHRP